MTVTATDHRVSTDRGDLFARTWTPSILTSGRSAAILLFHDSLGPVVAYDRLGFGRSDRHPGALPLTFIQDEAASAAPRLCETLGLGTIIPFGHSVGGAMAIATAARLPDRCAAVITESAQSFTEERTFAGVRAAQAEFEKPGQLERLARYHGAKARWVLDAWIGTWLSPAFASWRLDADLPAVRAPALALHGDRDEYGSVQHAHRIAGLTSGKARVVILENCGHVPHREQPARILDEVARFVATAD
jgi:pimeloyl-ACP methyl ester carboxylesterase